MPLQLTPPKILIVDDDEDDFIITSGYIKDIKNSSFDIEWAPSYATGVAKMANGVYDLYFVDYRLGAKSGLDFLAEAKKTECNSPIILLTGQGSYNIDLEAMHIGAIDYLIKTELNREKIERSIRYALDRAKTIKALRNSENKYRRIFEKSKDIIFVADDALCITEVNDAVTDILGYSKKEFQNLYLPILFADRNAKTLFIHNLSNGISIDDYSTTLYTITGKIIPCIISATITNSNANQNYIQGIIHDITNLKKAEKSALQLEKMAATSRLIRTLAHEVRNPLNNITISASQLQSEINKTEPLLYLDIIKRNSIRIDNLITELLHSSNPKDNSQRPTYLQHIIDEVVAAANDRITLKKIKLTIDYPSTPISIMADKQNLKLALLNILINATEAVKEISGIISIHLLNKEQKALMHITDNGCGISEENINRIFEPYYTSKQTGAGLGLSFTLSIMKAHGANTDVVSSRGEGTTFYMSFPVLPTNLKTEGAVNTAPSE
jgi:PAS domain S-box-containing protein